MEKPFTLGALSESIAQITSIISFSENGFTKPEFNSAVTKEGILDKNYALTALSMTSSSINRS